LDKPSVDGQSPNVFHVLAVAASVVAVALFAFGARHLVSKLGIANWSSLGVGALFVAIVGGIWLMGNSLLDVVAASGSALAGQGGGDWSALLFVWRSPSFFSPLNRGRLRIFEQYLRQRQLADEEDERGNDHIDNGQRQEKPTSQQRR
jgi:hypothetical protein